MLDLKPMRLAAEYRWDETSGSKMVIGWVPLVILVTVAVLVRDLVAPWASMWIIAFGLWAGCKWLTLWHAIERGGLDNFWRTLGFLFLWPGMDATSFFRKASTFENALKAMPVINSVIGISLFFLVAPHVENDLARGWAGMVGIILALHFGLFHLLAMGWQRMGVNAKPLMQSPATAPSLSEFWGRRWNTAFNQIAFDFVFRPAARVIGSRNALFATFLVSGLVHELVISVPAHVGYGLPTAYFILQGGGVLLENSTFGKRLHLRSGWQGWTFMMVFTGGPVFFLFPPGFIRTVILPMLKTFQFTNL